MKFGVTTQGRPGKRTASQKLQEDIRRARTSQDRYAVGGHLKEGHHAPRPITLPRLKFMDIPVDDEGDSP